MIQSGKFPRLFVQKNSKHFRKRMMYYKTYNLYIKFRTLGGSTKEKSLPPSFGKKSLQRWLNKNLYNLVFLVVFVFQFRNASNWVTFKGEKTRTCKTLFGFKPFKPLTLTNTSSSLSHTIHIFLLIYLIPYTIGIHLK